MKKNNYITEETSIHDGKSEILEEKAMQAPMPAESVPNGKMKMLVPAEEKRKTYYAAVAITCFAAAVVNRVESDQNKTTSNLDLVNGLNLLYAHEKTAIKELEAVRVNPDFTSQFRSDLEFFIPQLCSFYVKGDHKFPEDLVNLIVMASSSSFFFSHRVWFFFQSMLIGSDNESKEMYKKSSLALRGIKDACLKSKERLYLANSSSIVKLIQQFGLLEQHPGLQELIRYLQLKNERKVSDIYQKQVQGIQNTMPNNEDKDEKSEQENSRLHRVKRVILEYSQNFSHSIERTQSNKVSSGINQLERSNQEGLSFEKSRVNEEPEVFEDEIVITAKDIILNPFKIEEEVKSFKDSTQNNTANIRNSLVADQKMRNDCLNSYLSTPKFIKTLTEISLKLITVANRDEYLKNEILKLNLSLPASVYIPFVNVTGEAKIFQTKERAPLLLCIEAFRPEELYLIQPPKPISQRNNRSRANRNTRNDSQKQRSSSWNSSKLTIEELKAPLVKRKDEQPSSKNQFLSLSKKNDDKTVRQTERIGIQQEQGLNVAKDVKQKLSMRRTARNNIEYDHEEGVSRMTKAEMEKDEIHMMKINKMLDKKASNPLIINQLKRSDSFLEKVKVNDNYMNNYMKQASGLKSIPEENQDELDKLMFPQTLEDQDDFIEKQKKEQIDNKSSKVAPKDEDKSANSDLNEFILKPSYSTNENKSKLTYIIAAIDFLDNKDARYSNFDAQNMLSYLKNDNSSNLPESKVSDNHISQEVNPNLQGNIKVYYNNSDIVNQGVQNLKNTFVSSEDQKHKILILESPTKRKDRSDLSINTVEEEKQPKEDNQSKRLKQIQEQLVNNERLLTFAEGDRRSMSMLSPSEKDKLDELIFEKNAMQVQKQIEEGQKKKRPTETTKAFFENRPTNNIFLETGHEQDQRVRLQSPFGSLRTWRLIKIIVKSNDDVRQEQFAMQLISQIDQIFKLKKCNLWLRPYEILATGPRCGLIEVVSDAISIDGIKRKLSTGPNAKLLDYFHKQFGDNKSKKFEKARDNFCKSLAAYSLVCFVLQIKDRHNGNILVDIEGHIMHIDFGFLLSNAPGKGIRFELAPFKLTQEMVDVLGGIKSKKFREYRELMRLGFIAIQEHADKIIKLVEMMFMSQSDLPCFKEGENLIKELKQRIFPLGHLLTEMECAKYVDSLVESSYDNWRTKAYDKFQYCCQGIL
ncbi:phosphatidylinositol 4-kinase [Stylonychia lemnae]|uniref:1-phosphatidylinositol 4-kinase n=1 Tax=Stylonychia lemnae TaxID=5949 RepID=A0A078AZH5_STYLE|nr:phosphatidylinositol 4-kinase [Stylonychia lemnae]|eukprot:CDW87840.1 phosphatidylinositol 4-kinase [Stylonychia lemnae]